VKNQQKLRHNRSLSNTLLRQTAIATSVFERCGQTNRELTPWNAK